MGLTWGVKFVLKSLIIFHLQTEYNEFKKKTTNRID